MKLYIKQKLFSWADKFTIKDEIGNDRYYVEGELFSWGHKLHVYDTTQREVAFVKQKLMTWLPKFEVYMGETLVTTVVKEFTFLKPKYTLLGTNWSIQGNFWEHDYSIMDGTRYIVSISKEWFTWGDSYELNIISGESEILAVATVLAIDCVLETQNAAANN